MGRTILWWRCIVRALGLKGQDKNKCSCYRPILLGGIMVECLGCLLITEKPTTLRDGRVVCNECECWRIECEARHVLTLPHKRIYLEEIKTKRGEAAYNILRNEMLAVRAS